MKEKLEQPIITVSVTDNTNSLFCLEFSPVADYISLLERYNILVSYINEKTGEEQDKIKEISISKWQKANSYWSRNSLDYPFASDEEIEKAYNSQKEYEDKDIYNKILKLKEERISDLKKKLIYQMEVRKPSSNENSNNFNNYNNSRNINNDFSDGKLKALESKIKFLQKENIELKNKNKELENKFNDLHNISEQYKTVIDYFYHKLKNSYKCFDLIKKNPNNVLPDKNEFFVDFPNELKNKLNSLSEKIKKQFNIIWNEKK